MRVEILKEITIEMEMSFKPVKSSPGTYRPEFTLVCEEENSGEEKRIKLTAKQVADICDAVSVGEDGVITFALSPGDSWSDEQTIYFDNDVVTELVEEAWGH